MQIQTIEIFKSPIALKEPFKISLGILTHAANVVVKVTSADGLTGFGECSPFMSINGESIDTCFVVGQYLARALKGQEALDIAGSTLTMNKVIYGNNSIKSAFDMALYDIAAQNAGVPLYAFLGGDNSKEIFTDYTVSIDEPGKMAADALKILEAGFPVIKVKLGQDIALDLRRMQEIRAAVGGHIPVRIDANQGWNATAAIELLQQLQPLNIQHCEEPVPRWDFMSLATIRKASPIPIMADESCCDHHDAQRLVDLEACDLFNVKLGKSGGIYDALKIAAIAEEANIKIQVGGFLESRLAFTAAAHYALASRQVTFFDFDTPLMFTEDPVTGGIFYGKNGKISVPNEPGLGAAFDPGYLQGLEQVRI
jgi:L-alanine-DL-glutamate epimerase-like enolase superfamily enzyme